jgi:hypothetical protein
VKFSRRDAHGYGESGGLPRLRAAWRKVSRRARRAPRATYLGIGIRAVAQCLRLWRCRSALVLEGAERVVYAGSGRRGLRLGPRATLIGVAGACSIDGADWRRWLAMRRRYLARRSWQRARLLLVLFAKEERHGARSGFGAVYWPRVPSSTHSAGDGLGVTAGSCARQGGWVQMQRPGRGTQCARCFRRGDGRRALGACRTRMGGGYVVQKTPWARRIECVGGDGGEVGLGRAR